MESIPKIIIPAVYDHAGTVYYLILHNKLENRWELPKALGEGKEDLKDAIMSAVQHTVGLARYRVTQRLGEGNEVGLFCVEASMNAPVHINSELYDTYLWAPYDRAAEKIANGEDRRFLDQVQQAV